MGTDNSLHFKQYFEGTNIRKSEDHDLQGREVFILLRTLFDSAQIDCKRRKERMLAQAAEKKCSSRKCNEHVNFNMAQCDCHKINEGTEVVCWNCEKGEACNNLWHLKDASLDNMEVFETESMGKGVRATTAIKKGEYVGKYVGEIKAVKPPSNHLYVVGMDNRIYIDAEDTGAISRYFNSSCDPNLILRKTYIAKWPLLLFFAEKDIQVGEELTWNYKGEYNFQICLCKPCVETRGKENISTVNGVVQSDKEDSSTRSKRKAKSKLTTGNSKRSRNSLRRLQKRDRSLSAKRLELDSTKTLIGKSPPPLDPALPQKSRQVKVPNYLKMTLNCTNRLLPSQQKNNPESLQFPLLTPQSPLNLPSSPQLLPSRHVLQTQTSLLPPTSSHALLVTQLFKCYVEGCPRTFKEKKEVQRHWKYRHDPTPPKYSCDHCGTMYKTIAFLNQHIRRTHQLPTSILESSGQKVEPDHQCTICKKKYKYRRDVYSHIRKKHKDVTENNIRCCCGKGPRKKKT